MIIVVSADIGEFEAGICREGSTRLHLIYACTSGIENIVFAISKMESKSINKKKERWDEIVQELQSFCKRANVKAITTFVPINSLTGENILGASNSEDKSSSQFAEFYNGPTLMDVLKSHKKNTRDLIAKPARVLTQSFNGSRLKGMVVAGIVRVNETLSGGSSDLTLKVKAIWNGYKTLHRAFPGEVVEMEFESKAPQENWSKTKLTGMDLKFAKKVIVAACKIIWLVLIST
jgi:elongation factor 1-alpha